MPFSDYLSYLPNTEDLIKPIALACFFWALKKIFPHAIVPLAYLARGWILRDLKKARRIRRDPFAIQRQLAKEAALFAAFLVTSSLTMSALTVVLQGKDRALQAVYWVLFMAPVLALEVWWLFTKMFNDDLLPEASRLAVGFRRAVDPRKQSQRRRALRAERQELIKIAGPKPKRVSKKIGRRMI